MAAPCPHRPLGADAAPGAAHDALTDREGWAQSAQNSMERTRGIFRRPVVWIILVIVGAIALSTFFTGGQEYTKVDTYVAIDELRSGNVKKVLLQDREQNLQLDLRNKRDVE